MRLTDWLDIHKIFFDDESYDKRHGHLYNYLGISPENGVIVIIRPDQCEFLSPKLLMFRLLTASLDVSSVIAIDDYKRVGEFFNGCLIPLEKQGSLTGSKL
jgi:phenol 2-monooxygenase